MKKLSSFVFFLDSNLIADELLMEMIPLMNYEFIPKDNYLYQTGDSTKKFYYILKGSISIRERLIFEKIEKEKEKERFNLIKDKDKEGLFISSSLGLGFEDKYNNQIYKKNNININNFHYKDKVKIKKNQILLKKFSRNIDEFGEIEIEIYYKGK